jgi:lysine decarboxylase
MTEPDVPRTPLDPAAQLRAPYLEAVAAFARRGPRRYFVPGHTGGPGADPGLLGEIGRSAFALDVPQDMPGIDASPIGWPGLPAPPTPIAQAELLAADAYGAGRSWFLTNGATQGNHATMLALAPEGREILVQRNSHGSVVDGLVLSGGTARFVAPGYDHDLGMATVVSPQQLRDAIARHPDADAVTLVSPTYFGMVGDVAGCARVAHEAGMLLLVDCAWGPHFGFHEDLPGSALRQGADVVLTSTHKHGGSLTQSAILHVGDGTVGPRPADLGPERLARVQDDVARALRMLRSTSPSSLLMASLDGARRQLAAHGAGLLDVTIARVRALHNEVGAIPGCRVLGPAHPSAPFPGVVAHDPLRVVIDVRETGLTGLEVQRRLRDELDTVVELATHSTVVLVIGVQAPESLLREFPSALKRALRASRAAGATRPPTTASPAEPGETVLTPRQAHLADQERVAPGDAVGRVAAEAISGYPPGIPAVLPGERVTAAAVEHLETLRDAGVRLHGAADPALGSILVVTG